MIGYIKKDIKYSKKWLLIAILYCIIVGYVMVREEAGSFFFVYFLIPFFLVQLPLGKLMAMEDHRDTRDFLKRMPQKGWIRVAARELFVAGLLVIGLAFVNFFEYMEVDGYSFDEGLKVMSILFLCFLAYFTIEMIVFYRFSYHLAQNSVVFIIFAAMVYSMLEKSLGLTLDLNLILNSQISFIVLIVIDIILFFIEIKAEQVG